MSLFCFWLSARNCSSWASRSAESIEVRYRPYKCPPIRMPMTMMMKATMAVGRYSGANSRQRERRGIGRLDCVLSITASPVYCFDFGSGVVRSAPARRTPEIPESIERTPGISSAVADVIVFSGWAMITGPAFAVSSGAVGVAAPEVPRGGLVAGAGGGVLAEAPGEVSEDELPDDDVPLDALPPPGDCGGAPGALGSALRMIGSPSLPEPMTTILALGDCASISVASMPRQRR